MQETPLKTADQSYTNSPQDNQRIFRAILQTMSNPGTVTALGHWPQPPALLHPATAAVCLALTDMETPLWIDRDAPEDVRSYLQFHCSTPIINDQKAAAFAIILDGTKIPDLEKFNPGEFEYPDRSATLIIQVGAIEVGNGISLTGPGIKDSPQIRVSGLSSTFWHDLQINNKRFPLGYDVILATSTEIVSLPRTIQVGV